LTSSASHDLDIVWGCLSEVKSGKVRKGFPGDGEGRWGGHTKQPKFIICNENKLNRCVNVCIRGGYWYDRKVKLLGSSVAKNSSRNKKRAAKVKRAELVAVPKMDGG
jgi:hypothetical protein